MAYGSVATLSTVETRTGGNEPAVPSSRQHNRLHGYGQLVGVSSVPLIGSERPNAPVTTMLPPAVNVPQSSRPVTTPADEYARLTRRQRRDAREKKRIQKAARAARDELYRARQVVKDAQEVARAARVHASRYSYIPAPKNTRAISSTPRTVKSKNSKTKSAGSVHSAPMDMDETWSRIKESSSAASHDGSARDPR
ncbi:uncharacterized protein J4E92_006064 [Alternaria infectoria]|uniref:uncharacterized protein n=1 Tax=Alternaria infectoria TaxID=45303 RepID=UPI00221F1F56|nr:uncharacterized protein J4E92_006064 [Alternaria infectoria]KAI4926904.1 hypothetical protein J4E92_006064 [Alternaria infectoria]